MDGDSGEHTNQNSKNPFTTNRNRIDQFPIDIRSDQLQTSIFLAGQYLVSDTETNSFACPPLQSDPSVVCDKDGQRSSFVCPIFTTNTASDVSYKNNHLILSVSSLTVGGNICVVSSSTPVCSVISSSGNDIQEVCEQFQHSSLVNNDGNVNGDSINATIYRESRKDISGITVEDQLERVESLLATELDHHHYALVDYGHLHVDKPQSAGNAEENVLSGGDASTGCCQVFLADDVSPGYWQTQKSTVKERLAFLYNNETLADIMFLVGKAPQSHRFSAHRLILAMSSPVFDALLNGGMATTENLICIPDVEPSAFSALLTYIYTDDIVIDAGTVLTTLYAAKKYDMPALERSCVEFLKCNLSSDDAFMLLTQARLFDEHQLAALCMETIDRSPAEAMVADGFTDVSIDTLCTVLKRDTLAIQEGTLFSAVCRWAEAACFRQGMSPTVENRKSVLQGALHLIRFPLMTLDEFAVGAAQSGLLEDREVVELFLHFTLNPKPSVRFPDIPRCSLTGKEHVVSRFCQIESRWGYSGTSDRIRFMVNRPIFLVGFGLYGSIYGATEYAVTIQTQHMDTDKGVASNNTSFQCDGSTSTFRVMFKDHVEIIPNTNYIGCVTLKGPDSYYGSKGLQKVTYDSVSSGKITFQFAYAAGNNNGTSVEDGQIPELIFIPRLVHYDQ